MSTPGPWIWIDADELMSEPEWLAYEAWLDSPETEQKWVEDYHGRPIPIVETDGGCYGPRGADRALIAAAPDLLAVLKAMEIAVMRLGMSRDKDDATFYAALTAQFETLKQARAAIAKAEGKGQAA